ncbi:MAG: VacB/RNase II family 3'-5' exoribonuclease [Leptospiraceae bacterium]|nr:VacB/RNase II family 3'-5' exoribonuclease [Leptospiraceae bacterium]
MSIKKQKRNHNKPDSYNRTKRSQSSDNFSFYKKIIDFFIIRAGQSTTRTELIQKFATEEPIKNKKEESSKLKKKPLKGSSAKKNERKSKKLEWIENLLFLFETEGLIKMEKKSILIKRPFTLIGKISLSAKGDGFVKLASGNEAFVPGNKSDTAMAGDLVEISPMGLGRRDRMEAEILRIQKRGRVLYRMKVREIEDKFIFGKLLDMTGEEKEGLLLKKSLLIDNIKNIKIDDVLIVKMKDIDSNEPNLYEVSFVRFESDSKEDPDFLRVMMKYNFQQNHPDHISIDYPEEVSSKTVSDWKSRKDLTKLYAITIDGATAKDFDDAISFVIEDNKIRFWVHIADVSYYVRQGTALDDEAYERATSVYLSNRVIPMLPPVLSENLCSLVSKTNRLAFTAEMEADFDGNITNAKFYKSVINVDQRYTYEMAEEEILQNDPKNWMVQLNQFAKALRKNRMESGRVDLNLKESIMEIGKNFTPISIQTKERLQSHVLIEEMMLSANTKVAEFLRKKKAPALNRIHEAMDSEKLEALNAFLKLNSMNIQIKNADYGNIKKVLQEIHDKPIEKVFNYLLLRSFMQAYYGPEYLGHWGLGFQDYCHFTSPIRRYPDLIVHRVLHSVLLNESLPYTIDNLKSMGIHTSEEERKAADAERDIFKLKACRYLESTNKTKFIAHITGYKPTMVFVELDDPMMEASIPKSYFTNEFELVGRNPFTFYSKKYTKDFVIGQKLEVELEKIDYEDIKVYVKLIQF